MNPEEIESLIEAHIEDARATVRRSRHPGEAEDNHFAAIVVSPAFEGKTLVDQHRLVYDALGERMTTDVHALEIKTYTPEEYDARDE
jgi:stress-induced morphogen